MAGVRRRLAPKAAPSRADSLRFKQRGGTRVLRFGEGGPRPVSRPSPTEPRLPPGQHLQRWERVRGHGQRYAHHDQHSQHDHHGYSQAGYRLGSLSYSSAASAPTRIPGSAYAPPRAGRCKKYRRVVMHLHRCKLSIPGGFMGARALLEPRAPISSYRLTPDAS